MSGVCPRGYVEKTDWFGLVSRCVRASPRRGSTRRASPRRRQKQNPANAKATRRYRTSLEKYSNRDDCPPGMRRRKGYRRKYSNNILRKGFTVRREGRTYRAFPTTESMNVSSVCVKNTRKKRNKEEKSKAEVKQRETKQKTEGLSKYGYSYKNPSEERHKALDRAIEVYGPLKVFRQLHMLYTAAKISHRTIAEVLVRDRYWVYYTHKSIKPYLRHE